MIEVIAFDAYGTLFDVHAVGASLDGEWPGRGERISQLLRNKQLEYSFLRGLMGAWKPFRAVTEDALRWAVRASGAAPEPASVATVMAAYDEAVPFSDAADTLRRLHSRGTRCVVLTNGSMDMVGRAVDAGRIGKYLEAVLSVDKVETFKPHPRVYAMVERKTGVPPDATLLVSANGFDIAGAGHFGFQTCWVHRGDQPMDELDVTPSFVVSSLAEIPDIVSGS
jgi:2-haloacid dehalogenase